METQRPPTASQQAAKFMLRFEDNAHRGRLKAIATREKRSLNKQILLLIEAGEVALRVKGAPQ